MKNARQAVKSLLTNGSRPKARIVEQEFMMSTSLSASPNALI